MAIVFGIDGTDTSFVKNERRDNKYFLAFRNSFVSRICRRSPLAKYEAGPLLLGGTLMDAVNRGIAFVRREVEKNPSRPVLLTGYSRGAAGVVAVAQRLRIYKIEVKAMMLFDSVDRHMVVNTAMIPDNVRSVRHARRDPLSSSRETMGQSSTHCNRSKTQYSERFFMCTHGGMGGVPWDPNPSPEKAHELIYESGAASPKLKMAHGDGGVSLRPEMQDAWTTITYKQDAWVSEHQVWPWCEPWLLQQGFMSAWRR